MIRKLFIAILVIVGLLFLVAIVLRFLGSDKSQTAEQNQNQEPQNTETPVSNLADIFGIDDTNWKVFRNKTFGLEFKYPENWEIAESDTMVKITTDDNLRSVSFLKIKQLPATTDKELIGEDIIMVDNVESKRQLFNVKTGLGDSQYIRVIVPGKNILFESQFKKSFSDTFLPVYDKILSDVRFLN